MATTVANFIINPEDGWTKVSTGASTYFRCRSNTPRHGFYVWAGGSDPDPTDIGYKVICHEFKVNAGTTDAVYIRSVDDQPQGTRYDVFYNS